MNEFTCFREHKIETGLIWIFPHIFRKRRESEQLFRMCAFKYVLMCTYVKLLKKRRDMYKYILLLLSSHLKSSRFMDEHVEKGANASFHTFFFLFAQIGRRGERKGWMNAAVSESCSFPFTGRHGASPHFHRCFPLCFSIPLPILSLIFSAFLSFLPFSRKHRIQTNDDNNSEMSPFSFFPSLSSLLSSFLPPKVAISRPSCLPAALSWKEERDGELGEKWN